MKKLIFGIFAIASVLCTSCSQDELNMPANGEMATVSFSLDTHILGSRAYGDGLTATTLKYAVFDLKDNSKIYLSDLSNTTGVEFNSTSTTVPFQLATGHTYGFIFWAGNEDAPYTLDLEGGTVTIDYDGISANDETLDAFYAYKEHTVNGAETVKVDLYRPFTQINFGTNDLEASKTAGYTPEATKVVVSEAYKGLDLFTGAVSEAAQNVTFGYAELPQNETFPKGTDYTYLAMVYVLVPAEQTLVNTTLYHKNDNEYSLNVSNVPVQRNYRTNLYGALLTDAINVEVEKQPEYGDYDQEVVNVPDGQAVMNGKTYETIKEALAAMQEAGSTEATIYLGSGDYTAPKPGDFGTTADVVFKGNGDETVFNIDGARDFGSRSVSLEFENMKIVHAVGTGTYTETYGSPWTRINGLTYTKCSVEGPVRLLVNNGGTATFEGCNFVNTEKSGFNGYSINYYAYTGSKVVINNCEFNTNSKAVVMYGDGKVKFEMEVNNTNFKTENTDDKAAIQMHTELGAYGTLKITKSTATGFDTTTEGEGLWSEINNVANGHPRTYNFDIFVDGVQVHGSNKITVGGEEVTTLADALNKATDGSTVQLGYGDYDAKNVDWTNKNITIEGKGSNVTNIANLDFVEASGSSMTLSNLAFSPVHNSTNHTASGFKGTTEMTFNNCAINAEYHCYNGDFYFNDCEFNYNPATDPAGGGRYAVYAETSGTINFQGCTFSDTLMDKGILVYSDGNTELGDINLTDCTFYAAKQEKQNGCVEIHAEKLTKGGTVTLVNVTNNGYASLWREKNGAKKFYTIVVDNNTEQEKD